MRFISVLFVLVSVALAQWVEATIQLPDSLAGLDSICSLQFHSPNHTIYVGGNGELVAVDAGTHKKQARIAFPGALNLLCSSTGSNKLYCASYSQPSVWVMDGATNQLLATVPLDAPPRELCYAAAVNRVYVACPPDSMVAVIDCETDSVVARIKVLPWSSALCYNPELNRVYSAQSASDEVTVIDCAMDTVMRTIWVRGVKPIDILYDSATKCVYTANYTSGTTSVIDCSGDSLVAVVAAGARPDRTVAGPAGKVYCGGYADSVVTVVESSATRTIPVGRHLTSLSFDPVSRKVYCARSDSEVVVVDAIGDTVVARVRVCPDLRFVCYNPIDSSTWAASTSEAAVGVVDGATDELADLLWFRLFAPRALCYSPVSDRLYCLGQGLAVIGCDSSRALKILPVGGSADSMVWNPVNNKAYFSSPADNTVSVLDCAGDSITATVETGEGPNGMCCSSGGKVYVTTNAGGVAVIDPDGDSIRAVVPTAGDPTTLCYDRTDNKVYAGLGSGGLVSVIDVAGDSVVATIPVGQTCGRVCWSQNHNKVYVASPDAYNVVVIDCAGDTVLKNLHTPSPGMWASYSDSAADKVYFADAIHFVSIVNAATDTLYRDLSIWGVGGILDNGLPGPDNRLYCTGDQGVHVIDGANDDILRVVEVGTRPTALAWDPVHSRVYVSNSGSSSISVVSDTMLGIEEGQPQTTSHGSQATIVRGILLLPGLGTRSELPERNSVMSRATLLDISGRKVMDLRPGANDVQALAPGVYLVREAVGGERSAVGVRKVVVTR